MFLRLRGMAIKQNQNARVDAERDTIAPVSPPIKIPGSTGALNQAVKAWHEKHGMKFHTNAMKRKKKR